jgi:hypothetical protein
MAHLFNLIFFEKYYWHPSIYILLCHSKHFDSTHEGHDVANVKYCAIRKVGGGLQVIQCFVTVQSLPPEIWHILNTNKHTVHFAEIYKLSLI